MTEQHYLNFLNADDCALLMIDHQTGTMLGVQDIRLDQFRLYSTKATLRFEQ